MRRLVVIWLFFEMLVSFKADAQKKRFADFFNDILAIKEFKINSTLTDVKNQKAIGHNLSMFSKENEQSTYFTKDENIVLNGIGSFDDATLMFENDKLSNITLELIDEGFGWQYKQAYQKFKAFYGEPETKPSKTNPAYSVYTWHEGDIELKLRPLKISFLISYGRKIEQKKYWVQKDRKGKGNGSIQLSLISLEKLATTSLTVPEFESYLTEWKTVGANNRALVGLAVKENFIIPPEFDITYQLNDFNITVNVRDTTKKIIGDYEFNKIKNASLITALKKNLLASDYKIKKDQRDPKGDIYINRTKGIGVIIDNENKSVSIFYHKH